MVLPLRAKFIRPRPSPRKIGETRKILVLRHIVLSYCIKVFMCAVYIIHYDLIKYRNYITDLPAVQVEKTNNFYFSYYIIKHTYTLQTHINKHARIMLQLIFNVCVCGYYYVLSVHGNLF